MTPCACGHPFRWHGDRAVAACYGVEDPQRTWDDKHLSICPCNGYRAEAA